MTPLVSIIIPTWNRSSLLVDAVRSSLSQTVRSFEVLVCDDGSTDDSEYLVKSLQDSRVKWIEGRRFGYPGPARNRGIQLAQGKWVAFLDSDDLWAADKLERQLDAMYLRGLQASSTNAKQVIPSSIDEPSPLLCLEKDTITLSDLLSSNWIVCSSMLVDRNLLIEAGGFPEGQEFRAIEDYALWLKVSALTNIAYLSSCHVSYRDDPSTSIRSTCHHSKGNLNRRVLAHFMEWLKTHKSVHIPLRLIIRIQLLLLQAQLRLEPGDRFHLVK
jgi:teichuronic acid biosynthesis glycosyltransferase TuaG